MRIRDFLDAPEPVAAALVALGRASPGGLPFAAGPDRAERMGLRVSDEVSGIAVGVLDDDERAAHVPAWMRAQQNGLAQGVRPWRRGTGLAAGVTERVPVVLFAEGGAGGGVITQWATVGTVRGFRN